MKKLKYFSIVILALSILFFVKSFSLFAIKVNGTCINLKFLGLKILDRLPASHIPHYAWGFFSVAVIFLGISIISYRISKVRNA